MDGFVDIKALAELLGATQDEDQKFDDEQKIKPYAKKSDPFKRKIVKEEEQKTAEKPKKTEVEDVEDYLQKTEDYNDWRKTPEWSVAYKQKLTPLDMYLQMGGKTPSTASCEEMIITINLPGEMSRSIDIKVIENHLDLLSPMYRLSVPLPQPVDPKQSNEAKWHSEEEQLKLTLTMNREFDFVNF